MQRRKTRDKLRRTAKAEEEKGKNSYRKREEER
jgi:hypothetical protein